MIQAGYFRKEFTQNSELIDQFANVMSNAGNSTRFKILWLIYKNERSLKEISETSYWIQLLNLTQEKSTKNLNTIPIL